MSEAYAATADNFVDVLLEAYAADPSVAEVPLGKLAAKITELYPDEDSWQRKALDGLSYFQASWAYNKAQAAHVR